MNLLEAMYRRVLCAPTVRLAIALMERRGYKAVIMLAVSVEVLLTSSSSRWQLDEFRFEVSGLPDIQRAVIEARPLSLAHNPLSSPSEYGHGPAHFDPRNNVSQQARHTTITPYSARGYLLEIN
jgi:hypothetical protein